MHASRLDRSREGQGASADGGELCGRIGNNKKIRKEDQHHLLPEQMGQIGHWKVDPQATAKHPAMDRETYTGPHASSNPGALRAQLLRELPAEDESGRRRVLCLLYGLRRHGGSNNICIP